MRCLALAEKVYIQFQLVKLLRKIILTLCMSFRKSNLRKEVKRCIYSDHGLQQKTGQEFMQSIMEKRLLGFG